jgi:hypothetical protein
VRKPLRTLRTLLVGFLLSLLAMPAPAQQTSPQAWGLPELMGTFAGVKESTARYVERKHLSVLNEPLQASGVLFYAAPNYLRKETLQPKPELLLVERDKLTIVKDGRQQTLSRNDYPQIWVFIEGIRATLAGDLPQLQAVYEVAFHGGAQDWQLVLQPRDAKMREIVQSIRISGAGAHIRLIVTQERDGDRTELSIREIEP